MYPGALEIWSKNPVFGRPKIIKNLTFWLSDPTSGPGIGTGIAETPPRIIPRERPWKIPLGHPSGGSPNGILPRIPGGIPWAHLLGHLKPWQLTAWLVASGVRGKPFTRNHPEPFTPGKPPGFHPPDLGIRYGGVLGHACAASGPRSWV